MKILVALVAGAGLMLGAALPARAQSTTWPRTLSSPAGAVNLYQPQIDGFTGNQFTAHAAVSITPAGGGSPEFGAVFFSATVATDRDTGIMTVQGLQVTNSRFPSGAPGAVTAVTQALTQAANAGTFTFSQSQFLAQLALTQKEQAAAANLDNTPPQIWFETQPSVLVTIDGEPKLVTAPDSSLMTVVNSPFFIALDPATKTYYLRGGGQWLSTTDILQGPWAAAPNVPDAVTALAARQPAAPGDATTPAGTPSGAAPQVLVATQPTELIQTTGPAEYAPIDNTDLLYVTNTSSTVLMDIDTQAIYVLLSGRWFTAPSQAGPWTFVAPAQLPADFAKIPPGLPISNALASIPGTQAARNAALDAQVPQTAAIQRNAPSPKVTYDGDAKFEPVAKGNAVSYAVNATHAVVKVEDKYYLCSDGVWFVADAAPGPWIVADLMPPVIYTIPPTCPIYPVTYVRIYDATPEIVTCGYLPGYTGSYIYGGALVYGTGWVYPPWFGSVFIPRPVTWGFGASFNFAGGAWGFAVGAGWGVSSFGCSWNSGWWGVGNYRWNNWNFNNSWNQQVNITRNVTNITNNTTINRTTNNLYRNHPDRLTASERQRLEANERHLAQRDDHLQHEIDRDRNRTGEAAQEQRDRDEQQRRRDEARQQADRRKLDDPAPRNDTYADRDGNVYRHDGRGWQQRDGDQWRDAGGRDFDAHREDLNRQFGARARGYGGHDFHHSGGGGRRR